MSIDQAKEMSPKRALGFQARAVMVVMIAMHLACFAVIFVGFSWPALFCCHCDVCNQRDGGNYWVSSLIGTPFL